MSKAKASAASTPAISTLEKPRAPRSKPELLSDAEFLDFFNLDHPRLLAARRLKAEGDVHGAALSVAQNAAERTADGSVVGCIMGRDRDATRAAIEKHFGDLTATHKRYFDYCVRETLPHKGEVSHLEMQNFVQYAATGRRRGNDALTAALLYASTGDETYAREAIRLGLQLAAHCKKGPDGDPPAAYAWHPHASDATHGHDFAHAMQYWMQVWPLIEGQMQPADKLAWMKVLVQAAYDRFRQNITEIPFNITFHPLLGALQVLTAFPTLKVAAEWTDRIIDRFERDMCGLPCMNADGLTREHAGYHNVNTRISTIAYLTVTRALGRDMPVMRKMLEKAYEIQALFLTPNHQLWCLGDTMIRAYHEHWQDAHESLQLAAALFDRPDLKALSGSAAGTQPELLNAWLMGPAGIEKFAAMPAVDLENREWQDAHAPNSVLHALRAGRGSNAHAGLLAFCSSFNHGHNDWGEALIYGYGRKLISDPGHWGYGADHEKCVNISLHACPSVIRRTPLGPRHDWPGDWVQSLGTFKSANLSIAQGQHRTYENHIIKRALALAMPFGIDGPAIWLIHDQVDWKKGWPQGNEPMEMIDTTFPFHAPKSSARISADGRSVWSCYEGPTGAPFRAGGPSREELTVTDELTDSDANLQITALDVADRSQWDWVLQVGKTSAAGDGLTERPVAVSHWRGYLPQARGFALVPYRGVRDSEYAEITGKTTPGTLTAEIRLPEGRVTVKLEGLDGTLPGALKGTVKVKS